MTWKGRCACCGGWLFELTISSTGQAHVNCADPECEAYIGSIPFTDGKQPETLVAQEH